MKKKRLQNVKPEDAIVANDGRVVGAWNGNNVADLDKELAHVCKRYKCKLFDRSMPHRSQIPADIYCILDMYLCDFGIWGCDVNGNCLVIMDGNNYGFITDLNDVRCQLIQKYGFRLDIHHPDINSDRMRAA